MGSCFFLKLKKKLSVGLAITKKHENNVYTKHGKSIKDYSQKTYDQILATKHLWRMCDIESLFVPKNTRVTCISNDIKRDHSTESEIMFEMKPTDNNLMTIKSGYKTINFEKDRAYLLKANPKSIGADSGSIMLDGKHTHLTYGPNTSLPVVVIYDDAGISVTHETGKDLHAEVIIKGMTRKVTF